MASHPYTISDRPKTSELFLGRHIARVKKNPSALSHATSKNSTQRSQQKKPSIEEMFQALAKKIRHQRGEESRVQIEYSNDHVQDSQARTLRIEKEKQIGVLLSQLSKKFPISDVLEKKNIDELDEELAFQIQNRVEALPYFSKEGLPFSQSTGNNRESSPIATANDTTYSRNPNLMSTYSSKDGQMNSKIFGKLKHRDVKMPSTTIEKEKNFQALIRKKKQAKSINQYSFLNPGKLEYFRSHSRPFALIGETPNQRQEILPNAVYDPKISSTLYQLSYQRGESEGAERKSSIRGYSGGGGVAAVNESVIRQSTSILRNNPDDSYILMMADRSQRHQDSQNKVSASFIFNDEEEIGTVPKRNQDNIPREPTFEREDDSLVYYNHNNNDTTLNINISQGTTYLKKSSDKPADLRQYIPKGMSTVTIRPQFRAQTQIGVARKKTAATSQRFRPHQGEDATILPALADLVKMPKRLLPKPGVASTKDPATLTLYQCCPQAKLLDKEMELRMSPQSQRKSLISVRRDLETNQFTLVRNKTCERKSSFKIRQSNQKPQSLTRDVTLPGSTTSNAHKVHIDPLKVKEAISKIYEITKKNADNEVFRLEYDKKPIRYEYIDAHNINSFDKRGPRKIKLTREEDSYEEF